MIREIFPKLQVIPVYFKKPGLMGPVFEGFQARVVDDQDNDVADDTAGELVVRADDPFRVAGQAIDRDQCSACHSLDGRGVSQLFPSLADSSMVRSSDPTTSIRMVLRGARSVATSAEPTSPGMPSFDWQLGDAQVAAVVTNIRNAWGSAAAPVSARDVSSARSDLRGRTD